MLCDLMFGLSDICMLQKGKVARSNWPNLDTSSKYIVNASWLCFASVDVTMMTDMKMKDIF